MCFINELDLICPLSPCVYCIYSLFFGSECLQVKLVSLVVNTWTKCVTYRLFMTEYNQSISMRPQRWQHVVSGNKVGSVMNLLHVVKSYLDIVDCVSAFHLCRRKHDPRNADVFISLVTVTCVHFDNQKYDHTWWVWPQKPWISVLLLKKCIIGLMKTQQ